jgi:hypothetical protein
MLIIPLNTAILGVKSVRILRGSVGLDIRKKKNRNFFRFVFYHNP